MLLARLKPYNAKKGHLTRIYMIEGVRFYEERGWYQVSDDFGEKLRALHQDHYDGDSPELFDVCTEDEAARIEEREKKVVEVKATVRTANVAIPRARQSAAPVAATSDESGDLTSDDLKTPSEMIDPADDDEDDSNADEGRALEVGRVNKAPSASQGRSVPPTRTRKR